MLELAIRNIGPLCRCAVVAAIPNSNSKPSLTLVIQRNIRDQATHFAYQSSQTLESHKASRIIRKT